MTFFADEEEAFQKIRTGFRADLAHPCSQSAVKWRKAGIIEPIDTSRLKNWSKVIVRLDKLSPYERALMTEENSAAFSESLWFTMLKKMHVVP